MLVRVVDGQLAKGSRILMMAGGSEHDVQILNLVDPHPRKVESLGAGEVGLVIAGIKSLEDVQIGDTLTGAARPAAERLEGFRVVKPMVLFTN